MTLGLSACTELISNFVQKIYFLPDFLDLLNKTGCGLVFLVVYPQSVPML